MSEQPTVNLPRPEPEGEFRVPSQYPRCRRQFCRQQPVADMRRQRWNNTRWRNTNERTDVWFAYCTDHLREYNREVRDGQVWWRGYPEGEG